MAYKVTSGPNQEVLTRSEVRDWLKIRPDVTEEYDLLDGLIATARVWAERNTGRALLTQTVQEVWDDPTARCFYLSIGPLISVTSFEYVDSSGAYQTWASTNYTVDSISNPGRVVIKPGIILPYSYTSIYPNCVKITYSVGESDATAVDANIKTAMLLMIGLMYENREDMPLGKERNPTARSAWNLLSLSRLNWL